MNRNAQLVPFSLQSEAPEIFLVGQKDNEEPFVLNMPQSEPGFFFMRLELSPGIYRFRYYWSDGQNTVYLAPAHAGDSMTDDLDALIKTQNPKLAKTGWEFPPGILLQPRCVAY